LFLEILRFSSGSAGRMQGSAVLLYKLLETRRAIIPTLSRVAHKNRGSTTLRQVQYGTLAAHPMIVGNGIDIAEVEQLWTG
jgi:hypothetical protein